MGTVFLSCLLGPGSVPRGGSVPHKLGLSSKCGMGAAPFFSLGISSQILEEHLDEQSQEIVCLSHAEQTCCTSSALLLPDELGPE